MVNDCAPQGREFATTSTYDNDDCMGGPVRWTSAKSVWQSSIYQQQVIVGSMILSKMTCISAFYWVWRNGGAVPTASFFRLQVGFFWKIPYAPKNDPFAMSMTALMLK